MKSSCTHALFWLRDRRGTSVFESQPERTHAVDPRVAYLVEQMMEEVLRSGTGAEVRAKGFALPAAGKAGDKKLDLKPAKKTAKKAGSKPKRKLR